MDRCHQHPYKRDTLDCAIKSVHALKVLLGHFHVIVCQCLVTAPANHHIVSWVPGVELLEIILHSSIGTADRCSSTEVHTDALISCMLDVPVTVCLSSDNWCDENAARIVRSWYHICAHILMHMLYIQKTYCISCCSEKHLNRANSISHDACVLQLTIWT